MYVICLKVVGSHVAVSYLLCVITYFVDKSIQSYQ